MKESLISLLVPLFMAVSLATTILAVYFAVEKNPKYYWVGGLASYVFSFICSWSVGIYLLVLTFALFALAFAHTVRIIKNPVHSVLVIIVSTIIWWVCITNIDDAWLWTPFRYIY